MTHHNTEQPADTSLDVKKQLWELFKTMDNPNSGAGTVNHFIDAIAVWHQSQTTALLKRIREEVIGEDLDDGDGWAWAFGDAAKCCPGDDFAHFGNHIKKQQRKALDNLTEEMR